MVANPTRSLLEQAAAALDTAQHQLALVTLNLDGRLAAYGAGPDWQPHELVADVLVRSWPTPPGAQYQVIEFQSRAGVQVPMVSRPQPCTLKVVKGSLLIRRHDQGGAVQVCETGESATFRADERHGMLVLTDSHTILVFSI